MRLRHACREGGSGWPGSRGLLLLRLFGVIFQPGDPKHAVAAPQALVLGFLLSHCPPASLHNVATGIIAASLLTACGRAAGRFAAEVLPFCEALLHSTVHAAHRIDECAPSPTPGMLPATARAPRPRISLRGAGRTLEWLEVPHGFAVHPAVGAAPQPAAGCVVRPALRCQ